MGELSLENIWICAMYGAGYTVNEIMKVHSFGKFKVLRVLKKYFERFEEEHLEWERAQPQVIPLKEF